MGEAALLPEEDDPCKERQEPKPGSALWSLWATARTAALVLQLGSHIITQKTCFSRGLLSKFEALLFVYKSEKEVHTRRAPGDRAQLQPPSWQPPCRSPLSSASSKPQEKSTPSRKEKLIERKLVRGNKLLS